MKKLLVGFLALLSLSALAQQTPSTVDSERNGNKLKVRVSYVQTFLDLSDISPLMIGYKHTWTKIIQCKFLDDGSMQAIVDLEVSRKEHNVQSRRDKYKTFKFHLNSICDGDEVSSIIVNGKEVLK